MCHVRSSDNKYFQAVTKSWWVEDRGGLGLVITSLEIKYQMFFCAACKMTGGRFILNILYVGETLQLAQPKHLEGL